MGNAQCRRLGGSTTAVQDFLDFGGADPVTGSFDHVILAADEIQETFLIHPRRIARPHRQLRQRQAGILAGDGAEAFGGLDRIVPVAERHQGAAMHQFARFAGRAWRAVLAHDENFSIRNGLTDGIRPALDFLGRQVGGAKRLGQSVHQIRRGIGQGAAQGRQGGARHRSARVGQVA